MPGKLKFVAFLVLLILQPLSLNFPPQGLGALFNSRGLGFVFCLISLVSPPSLRGKILIGTLFVLYTLILNYIKARFFLLVDLREIFSGLVSGGGGGGRKKKQIKKL